jgi:4-amino-4-deoxy-L-arabinose transferase-like glycosyltransferase
VTALSPLLGDARRTLESLLDPGRLTRRSQWRAMVLIVAACVGFRLLAMRAPALDRSMWKEIDHLQISRNYWHKGFDFLRPELAWPAEPPRATAMELPLMPFLAALGYPLFGYGEYSARWPTLAAFALLPIYAFLLVRRELGPLAGVLAAWAAAVLPLYHEFGFILFSEPPMILCSVASLFHLAEWVAHGRRRDAWLGGAAFSMAIALKLEPLYLLLPIAWIAFRRFGWKPGAYRDLALLLAASLVLPVAWYAWAYHLGSTSIDVFGVLRGHDKFQTAAMLSQPEWWSIMGGRLVAIPGKLGSVLCLAGLAAGLWLRRGGLIYAYLAAVCASFAIVAEGNRDASYRQLPIVPIMAVFIGLGVMASAAVWVALARRRGAALPEQWLVASCLALASLLLVRANTSLLLRDPLVPAAPGDWRLAQEIRKHARPSDKLAVAGEYTVHRGGNDMSPILYEYTGLQGWTLQRAQWSEREVERLAARGASFFVGSPISQEADLPLFLASLERRYPVLFEDPERRLLVLDLRQRSEGAKSEPAER